MPFIPSAGGAEQERVMSVLTLFGIVLFCVYLGYFAFIVAKVYYLALIEALGCCFGPIDLSRVRKTIIGFLPHSFRLSQPSTQ